MQTEEVRSRFGRCPYCRAMIYQDLSAIIFYCSRCRTPIRGKNPQPADETEYALAQLEILSADTASVFSDDFEPPPNPPRPAWAAVEDDDDGGRPPLQSSRSVPGRSSAPSRQGAAGAATSSSSYRDREFGSVRTGARSGGGGGALSSGGMNRDHQTEAPRRSASPLHSRVTQLRPLSRRTRRLSSSDAGSGTESDSEAPATATATSYTRRSSPLSSQELDLATALSGFEPADLTRTPLSDPAFQKDLLHALDNLRRLIAAVDHPRSIDGHNWHGGQGAVPRLSASCNDESISGGKRAITRRSSRLMRRLESQLTRALPAERPRRDASASSSSSSASSSRRGGARAQRAHQCRPVLGGTPFVVCGVCSEVLQLPPALPAGRVSRLQCGGCGEAFELSLPAIGSTCLPRKIFSAPQAQPAVRGGEDAEDYPIARGNLSGEQPRAAGPLHRVLGYTVQLR